MKRKLLISALLFIAMMWVMHTLSKNFMVDPSFTSFLANKDVALSNQSLWTLMIQIHIGLAIIALITGPLGLIKRLRIKNLTFHKWNGRLYVLSIVLNFIPGVYVAFFASGGLPSTIGFLVLNTLWLVTTLRAYIAIRAKKVEEHVTWIIRSFFLSFANMTIYIILAITHHGFDLAYGLSYTIAVWLCWMINLLLAEWLIRRKIMI
ncbi:DUF2306 domain-containing protein [Bacillus horti]|uniref:Membrane protein n=1 Tax=Caldalkalibacillus horti TaxID=77523 RepID=A0ABT9W2Y7_9BACI|nr:DUF2306 domain-containing protein [Bacillus horti]MDQ0167434.1 putative membrane protein [Bacillus horti]